MVLAYVSAIHDISRSPVLMSGAGTSMPGPGQERWVEEGVSYTDNITHSTFSLIEPGGLNARLVSATLVSCRQMGEGISLWSDVPHKLPEQGNAAFSPWLLNSEGFCMQ